MATADPIAERSIVERVPVYTHDGERVGFVDAARALKLIETERADARGTRNKIHAIRLREGVPIPRGRYTRRSMHGDAHRRETETNPRGVWTLDRMPDSLRPIYMTVVIECLTPDPSETGSRQTNPTSSPA